MRFGLVALLPVVLLTGCAGQGTDASNALSVDEACAMAQNVAALEPTLPVLTQCEFQDSAGRTVFVLQFEDPVLNEYTEALVPGMETMFDEPLASLLDVWEMARAVKEPDAYIVSFRDQCQNVWEIPSGLMNDALGGSVSVQQLRDLMEISSLSVC